MASAAVAAWAFGVFDILLSSMHAAMKLLCPLYDFMYREKGGSEKSEICLRYICVLEFSGSLLATETFLRFFLPEFPKAL